MDGTKRIEIYNRKQELPDIYFLKASIMDAVVVILRDKPAYTFEGYIYGDISFKMAGFESWVHVRMTTLNTDACIDLISWVSHSELRDKYIEIIRNMKESPNEVQS